MNFPLYERAIAEALLDTREWVERRKHTRAVLHEDVHKLPKDCPLWGAGLSLAQATLVWAKIWKELP